MGHTEEFVDIHCHLIPGIDDGAKSWDQAVAMARIASSDGIKTIVVTPHQLGAYEHNSGAAIRMQTLELQAILDEQEIPLQVHAGADVRIDTEMVAKIRSGEVLTLANRMRHVLLELPHELYFPLETVLDGLHAAGLVGVLSHPERNQGILKNSRVLQPLLEYGCLMQITAGSLMGTFGPASQQMGEWMLERGLVHFVATDAHGPNSRRPLMSRAFHRVAELVGLEAARLLCCHNPAQVVAGGEVLRMPSSVKSRRFVPWLPWRKSA